MTTTEIVTSIDQRLTEAKAEIVQLEGARDALLNGTVAGTTQKPARTPRKPARRRAAAPKYDVVPAGKLTTVLDGAAGMSTAQLAQATNGKPDQILALLRELERTDQIRRTGQRRATRWHLITDEERIAARAAEIAAQSKRRPRKAA